MKHFEEYVAGYGDLLAQGESLPLGGFEPLPRPKALPDAPKALFFSPHPDDECISGGIAVRVMREMGANVLNVAVTQGSSKARQAERLVELKNACDYIGFGLITTGPSGLEKIHVK